MPTRTASTNKITRQSLPSIMAAKFPDPWSPRITKYLFKDADVKKTRGNPDFTSEPGEVFQVGGFRLQRIGSLGSMESGELLRIVQISVPSDGEAFPDYLGELCEDTEGPLGERASTDLRERFDLLRCEFNKFGLFGDRPVLSGVKRRRDQRKTLNDFGRRLFPKDRAGAKLFADMLADNIENMEPAVELE